MDHLPIYRSSTRRGQATLLQWRRTASWGAAGAALTLSGMALGYQGFSQPEPSTEPPPVAVAGITVTAPMVSLPPLVDGGHPDIITSLSAALIAHIQAAPATVQQLLLFGPLGPLLGPQPVEMTVAPVDFSAVLDEPTAVVLDEAPVQEDAVTPPEEPAVEPNFTPLVAPARTLSFATVAIAPPDDEPEQVESSADPAPAPDPAPPPPAAVANVVSQPKPQTVAVHAAPPPVVRPQMVEPVKVEPAPVRGKPAPEVKRPEPTPVADKRNGNDNKNKNDKGGKGDSSKHGD